MSTPSDRTGLPAQGDASGLASGRGEPDERSSACATGPESLVGDVLSGRYLIERLIGEGGMGAVYQAEHTHMRKRMAVKVLHAEMSRLPEVVARFEREAMAAAHIEHPNVAAATDFGKLEDGSFFLVLEYVEGRSLRDAIVDGPLAIGRALHVMRQIASGLGRAHAIGIVHRDLKPENIMLVARDDDADFVKVLDFGIAKVPVGDFGDHRESKGQALTQLGMVYGTPEYMAPEQALGQPVDPRADLYALGVMAFEMLTGKRPYDHESKVTLLGMHVTAPIPRMSERAPSARVPVEVETMVARLLSKDAAGRFTDAKELIDAIDAATPAPEERGALPQRARPVPALQRASAPCIVADAPAVEEASLELGPDRIAEALAARGPNLGSLVSAAVVQMVRRAPRWVWPRSAVVAAAGLVFATVVAGALMRWGLAPVGPPTTVATAPSAAINPLSFKADPKTHDLIAVAQGNIEKGDFATAIDQLVAVEKSHLERADVHMGLERAYTGVRNAREAMHEAGLWLAADPSAAADHKLEEDVRNAALVKETQDEAFALLEGKMAALGVDILYDIAYGATGKLYPQAAARAKRSLASSDVRGRASVGLAVLLDFREARTCESKHGLLERARDQGDSRILALLQQLQSTRGCGFLGVADCYPCLRRDGLLSECISAVGARAARAQAP